MKRRVPAYPLLRLWAIVLTVVTPFLVSNWSLSSSVPVTRTWDGGGVTNDWSEAANWSGDVVPSSVDIAVFDATSVKNSVIDVAFAGTVAGIQINSGYTGTITHNSGAPLNIGSSGYSQSSGTFSGSNDTVNVNSNFNLSGGTFNASSGTTDFFGSITIGPSGVFNHNNGTVVFASPAINALGTISLPLNTSLTLNHVTINRTITFNTTFAIAVVGTLNLNDGFINQNPNNSAQGTLNAQGPINIADTFRWRRGGCLGEPLTFSSKCTNSTYYQSASRGRDSTVDCQ